MLNTVKKKWEREKEEKPYSTHFLVQQTSAKKSYQNSQSFWVKSIIKKNCIKFWSEQKKLLLVCTDCIEMNAGWYCSRGSLWVSVVTLLRHRTFIAAIFFFSSLLGRTKSRQKWIVWFFLLKLVSLNVNRVYLVINLCLLWWRFFQVEPVSFLTPSSNNCKTE